MENNAMQNDPQIAVVLKALKDNGLEQEYKNVQSFVIYADAMQEKLDEMSREVQSMRQEIQRIHNKSLAGQCEKLIADSEKMAHRIADLLAEYKENIRNGCREMINDLHNMSREALQRAIQGMKIPAAVEHLRNEFQQAAQSMGKTADQINTMRENIHDAKNYLKNAVRVLTGKKALEAETLEADKGALAKVRNIAQRLESSFASMERGTDDLLKKLEVQKEPPTLEKAPEEDTLWINEENNGNPDLRETLIQSLPENQKVSDGIHLESLHRAPSQQSLDSLVKQQKAATDRHQAPEPVKMPALER